jgi:ABC-type phosphate/phosphonate transport system substrate-binding protein
VVLSLGSTAVFVATSYNAEIEAMRNGKLEIGEFGSLGYVLAHQVAKAEAVAAFGTADGKPDTYWASIVTYPGSGIKTVAEIKMHNARACRLGGSLPASDGANSQSSPHSVQ